MSFKEPIINKIGNVIRNINNIQSTIAIAISKTKKNKVVMNSVRGEE